MRWLALALGMLVACGEDEPRECDLENTPTCESQLIVNYPDSRTDFSLRVIDDLGMDIQFSCPAREGVPNEVGGYSWICGEGRATVFTNGAFGDNVRIQSGVDTPQDYTPDYSRSADFCGNGCTSGIIGI